MGGRSVHPPGRQRGRERRRHPRVDRSPQVVVHHASQREARCLADLSTKALRNLRRRLGSPRWRSEAGRPDGARAPGSTLRALADRRLRWLPLDQGPETTGNRASLGKPNPAFRETGDPVIQLTTLVGTGIHAQARNTDSGCCDIGERFSHEFGRAMPCGGEENWKPRVGGSTG